MTKNILLIVGLLLLVTPFIFAAGVTQVDTFYDSSGNPLTNVRNVFYNCAGAYNNPQGEMRCTSIGSLLYDLNSGSSNSITLEYPYNPFSTESNPNYYAQYLYRDCYMPQDFIDYVWGGDVTLNYNYNFYKVQSCHSPIDSFSITNTNYANEPVVVNVAVVAEADAESPFTDFNNGEVWYPPQFIDHYSAETKVTFSVLDSSGNVAYIQSKTVNIYMDSSENIQFTWTPSLQGNFTARIETEVIDCQCESNFKQYSEKEFLVWAERPKDECYTIINDLETNPKFTTAGNPITITFNKISNYADNSYAKTALPTNISYEITQENILVYSSNSLIPANANTNDYQVVNLGWTPSSGGEYAIRVQGFAQSPLCTGKTNPVDTEILGIFVDSLVKYNVQFIVEDASGNPINQATVNFGSSTGETDSFGNLNFKVNPETYDWQVSKSGYVTQNGSLLVNGNKTVSVVLLVEYAPVLNIPNQYLSENSGYNNDIINLEDYTTDADTPISSISYLIDSQSNTSIVNCSVDSSNYLDCSVKNNAVGFSEVTISASDGTSTGTDSFRIYVGNFINGTMVKLVYPIGGEKLSGSETITWVAINSEGHSLLISLYYSTDNGTIWNVLKENETNDGSYIWNTRIYPNGKYLLKIKAFDLVSGTSVFDQTDSEFSIANIIGRKSSKGSEKVNEICEPLWQCSGWNDCFEGTQRRVCGDVNFCYDDFKKPSEMRVCGDYQTGNIILSLNDLEKSSLGEKIFFWIILAGLLLMFMLIIFILFLFFKED